MILAAPKYHCSRSCFHSFLRFRSGLSNDYYLDLTASLICMQCFQLSHWIGERSRKFSDWKLFTWKMSEFPVFDPSKTLSLWSCTSDHYLLLSCSISCCSCVCKLFPSASPSSEKRKPSSIDFLPLWDQNSSVPLYTLCCELYHETSRRHAAAWE